MKSKVTVLLAVLLSLSLMLPLFASAETVSLAYKGGALNLRKGPGTDYASVAILKNGDHITVQQKGDVWSKVKTDAGKVGYIKNLYIKSGDKNYASGTTYVDAYTVYTTGNVNFRAGAGTSTKSMGVLPKGTKLTALGKNGNFMLVQNSKGTQGYVSKNYLSTSKPGGKSSSSSSSSTTKTISGNTVNFRATAGVNGKILKVLKKGTEVKLIKAGKSWSQVEYKGVKGWVYNSYLK